MKTGAMAEDSPVQGLCDEITCSVCLGYYKDPVILDCGHNFCQACVTQCWQETDRAPSCPQCRQPVRQKNFKPNRQLANIVEITKKFSLQRIKGAEAPRQVCERHQEPLKLFCQHDQVPICVVCDKSKEHRGHRVIPMEEAFEEYKIKGQAYLEFLKKEREAIWSSQQSGEAEGQSLLEQTEQEGQKIMADFKQMRWFLEAQERLLMAKLKDMKEQIKSKRNANKDKLSEEISAVDLLIKEMEKKQKQSASEFLQDLKNVLQWCNKGKFVNPVAFPFELKQKIENFSNIHYFLDTTMNAFKEKLTENEDWTISPLVLSTDYQSRQNSFGNNIKYCSSNKNPSYSYCGSYANGSGENKLWKLFQDFKYAALAGHEDKKVNFSDNGTCTIPTLVLSADCSTTNPFLRGARQQHSPFYNVYQNPSQFACWSYVMGVERINSGSFSWVMNVKKEKFWAVGIALECFRENNMACLTPEEGIWAVGESNDIWYALTYQLAGSWPSNRVRRACRISPCNATTIQVSLNYEQGSVTFFNANNNSPIYTFSNASFCRQPISSWFFVGK